jgi:D-glycero-D-manno-heptose 1,7-bisphosphate phosphatase
VSVSQCVILVGGLATRLGPIAAECPKPLLEVDGQPFLATLLEECDRRGFSRILLLAGHQASQVAQFAEMIRRSPRLQLQVDISVEPEPKGTAGALRHARDSLDSEFLLLNGDSWFDFNWLDLAQFAANCPSYDVAMALRREQDATRFGVVQLHGGNVKGFVERGTRDGGLINGGVYVCRRSITADLPAQGSLERDVFPLLAASGRVCGKEYDGPFIDIGVPSSYSEAQSIVHNTKRRPAAFLDRDGVINLDPGYVFRCGDLTWVEGAVDAIKLLNDKGFYVFVITNQSGVARGYYTEEDVRAFHRHMLGALRRSGAAIDDFRYCPDHPDGTIETYRRVSNWRKPEPGMILDLLEHWPIDFARSFLIGDKSSDIAAAAAAGLPGYVFNGDNLFQTVMTIIAK